MWLLKKKGHDKKDKQMLQLVVAKEWSDLQRQTAQDWMTKVCKKFAKEPQTKEKLVAQRNKFLTTIAEVKGTPVATASSQTLEDKDIEPKKRPAADVSCIKKKKKKKQNAQEKLLQNMM